MITPTEPRTVALTLIKATALDAAARHARGTDEPRPANWSLHDSLTTTLESWQRRDALNENSLLAIEWLAVELAAYLARQLGTPARMDQWLLIFGDQVSQAQQHAHPAGPTAIEILSVAFHHLAGPGSDAAGAERLARIGAPYLHYLRPGHQVEDAREMVLTLALWAGAQLAALMQHDTQRITAYTDARST